MTIPLQFASLYDRQEVFVWSTCLLDLGTAFLVGNMVFVRDVLYLLGDGIRMVVFKYFMFTRMPGDSYHYRFRSLLLCPLFYA